jgi:hypothetical protein
MELEAHLGGHQGVTHTDEGTLRWAMSKLNITSMLDVGCGPGGMVELANSMGINAHGLDGDYTVTRYDESKFTIHDFTHGPAPVTNNYDLGWSVEFVEHVYQEYIPNYMTSFQACKVFVMTYAPVGATGYHHVNCNTEEYWIETMSNYGFKYNPSLTVELRKHSTMGKKRKHQFLKRTGLLFQNEQI